MYNNGFPLSYQPYQMPYQMQPQQPQPQVQPQNGGMFYFVNNKQEAENWMVNAGQTMFFFDRNASVFYIKSVAQNGLSQPIEVYDYKQRVSVASPELENSPENKLEDKYITRDEFEALKAKIEAMEVKDNE